MRTEINCFKLKFLNSYGKRGIFFPFLILNVNKNEYFKEGKKEKKKKKEGGE